MYSLAVFTGGRPFCTFGLEFYLNRVVPQSHRPFLALKTRVTGLPDGEDRIRLRSVVSTQYRSITDRRISIEYTALAARCIHIIIVVYFSSIVVKFCVDAVENTECLWTVPCFEYCLISILLYCVQLLDIIGNAAFGYQFNSLTCPDHKVSAAFWSLATGSGLT